MIGERHRSSHWSDEGNGGSPRKSCMQRVKHRAAQEQTLPSRGKDDEERLLLTLETDRGGGSDEVSRTGRVIIGAMACVSPSLSGFFFAVWGFHCYLLFLTQLSADLAFLVFSFSHPTNSNDCVWTSFSAAAMNNTGIKIQEKRKCVKDLLLRKS